MKLSVLCATTLVATVASAADCPVRDHWPTDEWRSRVEDVAPKKQAEIAALEQYAFTRTGADAERKGIRTDAVLVIHDGAVIYEKYAPGWNATKRHLTWSASKSVTSALTSAKSASVATAPATALRARLPRPTPSTAALLTGPCSTCELRSSNGFVPRLRPPRRRRAGAAGRHRERCRWRA